MTSIIKYTQFAILLGIISTSSFSAKAESFHSFEGGRICNETTKILTMDADPQHGCLPEFALNEDGKCAAEKPESRKFAFILNENKTLDFGINYWSYSGHNCMVHGNAVETDDGWLYQSGINANDDFDKCYLTIRMSENDITLETREQAACASYCGTNATLDGLSFPLATLVSMNMTPAMLHEDIHDDLPCD
jgi:hypothetical protein